MSIDNKRTPVEFKVVLSDRTFNILELPDNQIEMLDFEFAVKGGCGGFSFTLPRNYCDEKYISGGFNIKIYIRNDSTKAYDLWYQGLVEEKTPKVNKIKETIDVVGHGYQAQLANIQLLNVSYTSQEISVIIKGLLTNYILANTDITYDNSDIDATSFTVDSIKFNGTVQDAIKTLGDLAGAYVWGVDKDRKFYFKAKSTLPGFYGILGKNITSFTENQSFREIVNRIIVQGGDIAGTPYTATYNDTSSQLKFGRRDKVVQNSAVTTASVSSQLATSLFTQYSDVIRKASCEFIGQKERIEATIPIPLFVLKSTPAVTYGTKKYGTFLYSGIVNREITRISYSIDNLKALRIGLDLGFYMPSEAENFKQITYNLEQVRTSGL